MTLYILLDTSGSMQGAKIGALNDCMSNIIIDLQETAYNGQNIDLSVMSFARSANWMYEEPRSVLDFEWKVLDANGMTSLGEACTKLSNHLDVYKLNENATIVLISDGCPTDDFEEGMQYLKKNDSFVKAHKFAIAVGQDADINCLIEFTDTKESIYSIDNVSALFDLLLSLIEKQSPNTSVSSQNKPTEQKQDDDDDWS